MKTLTMKKPIYLGASAQVIAGLAEAERRGSPLAERSAAGRAAVGRTLKDKPVEIVRVAGTRWVLADGSIPEGVQRENSAVIRWVGEAGEIVLEMID